MREDKGTLLTRYYICVEYKEKGYTNAGNIFVVLWEIYKNLKKNAKITIYT